MDLFYFTIDVVLALVSLIPTTILYKYYRKTSILDYLIFSSLFFSAFINLLIFAVNTDLEVSNPILSQIEMSSYIIIMFLILIHTFRIKWEKTPPLIFYPNLLLFLFLLIPFELVFSPEAEILILINTLGHLYRIGALIFAIYVYTTVNILIEDVRLERVRKLWILVGLLLILFPIQRIGLILNFWGTNDFIEIMSTTGLILVALIALIYPEFVLISKIQISKAINLYTEVLSFQSDQIEDFGMKVLVNYLRRIPPEIIGKVP
ncbi:MAG: hypothetical protein ACFFC6_04780 [Promethearchaeota archaeon]